jgi:acylphosphatase
MEQVHTEVRIRGNVQGVFFRKCTRDEALKLGVNGTVENMPDGSVLMHAQGKMESVQKLVE